MGWADLLEREHVWWLIGRSGRQEGTSTACDVRGRRGLEENVDRKHVVRS